MLFPITLVLFISPAAAPEDGTNGRVSVSTCTATSCSAFVQALAAASFTASMPEVSTVNFSTMLFTTALKMLHIRASVVHHVNFGEVVAIVMAQYDGHVVRHKLALHKARHAPVPFV